VVAVASLSARLALLAYRGLQAMFSFFAILFVRDARNGGRAPTTQNPRGNALRVVWCEAS
jgi:hypothetical protein